MNSQPSVNHKSARQFGQGLVEYALILVAVAAAAVLGLAVTGTSVRDVFERVVNGLNGVEENPGYVVVSVVDHKGDGISNVRVYGYTDSDRYTGRYGNTNANGDLDFENMDDGRYKFRTYYQTGYFWSDTIAWPNQWHAIIETGQRPFTVNVVDNAGAGLTNVRVYAFNEKGQYTGIYGNTDANGQLTLNLVNGAFQFRADYQTRQYWSALVDASEKDKATVQTGQRPFTVNVVDNAGAGLNNVRVYAFNEKAGYTGVYGNTDSAGRLTLNLADGDFQFRADYQTHQYWSDIVNTPEKGMATLQTGQRPFTVNVVDSTGAGLNNVRVYAFNEKEGYTGIYGNTDENGRLTLDLSDGSFQFRADYQTYQFWSDIVNTLEKDTATVHTEQRPFTINVVDNAGSGISNVRVYVFNDKESYTGVYGNTDASGQLTLDLAAGDFKFRVDYQANYYWSNVVTTKATDEVTVSTGRRPFTVKIVDNNGQGINNIHVYAFNEKESYLGEHGYTDAAGQVTLNIADGEIKFRVTYNGANYWSNLVISPNVLTATVTVNQN